MEARKTLLSALVACLGCVLFVASCATPATGGGCPTGQMSCNGQCINVMGSDSQNCGACGHVCGTGSTCQSGTCACGSGLLSCNNACVSQDTSNCGSCGHTCTGTQVCASGTCSNACPTGTMQCSGGTC